MKLQAKTVLISGASSGIGLAMALEALARKARVLLLARNPAKLAAAEEACLSISDNFKLICLDISNADELQKKISALLEKEKIDILVNNAGVSQRSVVLDTEAFVEQKIMAVNFWGAVNLTKAILPQMLANGGGHIAVTSSVTGLFGVPLRSSYCAAKHALHGYFQSLYSEYYQDNIAVTIACPGKIATEISLSALIGTGEAQDREEPGHVNSISPKLCSKIFWRAIERKKLFVYIARIEKVMIMLQRLKPSWAAWLIRLVLPLGLDASQRRW